MSKDKEEQPSGKGRKDDNDVFKVVLYPNRSLSRTGFFMLMAVLLGSNILMGGLFWERGAWPILVYYVIQLLIVWIAFKMNYSAGRAYEVVRLDKKELVVEDHSKGETSKRWVFKPYAARVVLRRSGKEMEPDRLMIMAGREGVEIGSFLTNTERRTLAQALETALKNWRP